MQMLTALKRFPRAASGMATVDFAIVAIPFLSLICVPLDAGLLIAAQMSLDANTDRETRSLFTGTVQAFADGKTAKAVDRLRERVCEAGYRFFDCATLRLESTSGTSFASAAGNEFYDSASKGWSAGFGDRFVCPNGGDIVVVRAAVPYRPVFSFIPFADRKMADGSFLLVSTYVLRAEPYPSGSCT